jgi:hypothetical protein
MPTPDEARLLATMPDVNAHAPQGIGFALHILNEWLAAGAPRCAEARRIPKGR